MNEDLLLSNVRAVLPDRVLDDATIVVEDGRIVDIRSGAVPGATDGAGLLVLPGLIDVHSDGLEKEISPRRNVQFDAEFALTSFEGRVRSAGVTTVFHGLGYQDRPDYGRTLDNARAICDVIRSRHTSGTARVNHELLYRFEARDATALDPMLDDLERSRSAGLERALVSFEDHTPGQGQFHDIEQYKKYIDPTRAGDQTVDEYIAGIMAEAERNRPWREKNLARLAPLATSGAIRLIGHDLDAPEAVSAAAVAGVVVAEFPLSVETAIAAREHDMDVVAGAPNVVRGGSSSGNVSAAELIEAGVCTVLASDYMPSSLLAAAFAIAEQGLLPLHQAVRLITSGPASMTRLDERGQLTIGALADLIIVDDRGRWPRVVSSSCAADEHHLLAA